MHLVTHYSGYILAGDPTISPLLLEELAQSHCANVRGRVAENPSTSLAVLLYLTHDPSEEVRISLTYNAHELPLSVLANDKSVDVRYALAENHYAPQEVLRSLSHDDNPYVATRARRTLELRSTDESESKSKSIAKTSAEIYMQNHAA
jgi:uncharacterized protein YqfB (UPF0267 family)